MDWKLPEELHLCLLCPPARKLIKGRSSSRGIREGVSKGRGGGKISGPPKGARGRGTMDEESLRPSLTVPDQWGKMHFPAELPSSSRLQDCLAKAAVSCTDGSAMVQMGLWDVHNFP